MENIYDVIIIGGGPAGLTAAIYLARAKYRALVLEKEKFGGQITITSEVVNYPGVGRTDGTSLTETMRRQAESFGAEFMLADAKKLARDGAFWTVETGRGTLKAFGVLIATGAHPRMVGFKGEEEFRGRGVAYCATCDGEFFTGKEVFVVGGGFAAAEESVFLTKYARHVTILIRGEDFTCAASTAEEPKRNPNITILTNTSVDYVKGGSSVTEISYTNSVSGETTVRKADAGDNFGVFVFAGYEPATDIIKGVAELDERGYVVTDRSQKTNLEGLYAAGDVCIKPLRQVVTAVGDGALAATELEKYASRMQKETGVLPQKPEAKKKPEPQNGDIKHEKSDTGLFTPDIRAQLQGVFSRMANPLELRLSLDDREVSKELKAYMEELAGLTDKLSVTGDEGVEETPCVRVFKDGKWTGLAFHGAPGGHEFTSFVLGLYNASGPGQSLAEDAEKAIAAIKNPVKMQVLVSLTCTMCPELVTAAQRIASLNENVSAEVYDLNHFPALREKYNVMSVPCLVVNESSVTFGKKNVGELLSYLGNL